MPLKNPPDGQRSVTPYLLIAGAASFIEFAENVFGARVRLSMPMPDGKVGHSELELGDSVLMVADATDEYPAVKSSIHLYLDDVDAVFNRALAAGATATMELADQFYGDRAATIVDPFGNQWWLATHIEDVSQEEVERRLKEMGLA